MTPEAAPFGVDYAEMLNKRSNERFLKLFR